MKKSYQIIGIITLIFFSFFCTEKTSLVIKNTNELMIQIKENIQQYEIDPVNAKINGNEIIPGINGAKVNIDKTYEEMKRLGYFNSNLIKYDTKKPCISLYDNYNKYVVSGNPQKKMISIIFVTNNNNIDNLITFLNKSKIESTLFVNVKNANISNQKVTYLKNIGYDIGYYVNDNPYGVELSKSYCLLSKKNNTYLNYCAQNKAISLYTKIIIKKNLLKEVKTLLKAGSLIYIEVNENTINELESTIIYIKSKGYKIKNLYNHLKE